MGITFEYFVDCQGHITWISIPLRTCVKIRDVEWSHLQNNPQLSVKIYQPECLKTLAGYASHSRRSCTTAF